MSVDRALLDEPVSRPFHFICPYTRMTSRDSAILKARVLELILSINASLLILKHAYTAVILLFDTC